MNHTTNEASNQLQVITFPEQELSRGPQDLIIAVFDVAQLREKFKAFLASLHSLVDCEQDSSSPFQLQEVEFSVEISAEGDFKLLGVGTSVGTTGAVKFVLKRNSSQDKSP